VFDIISHLQIYYLINDVGLIDLTVAGFELLLYGDKQKYILKIK
jgi:hypothetical protein